MFWNILQANRTLSNVCRRIRCCLRNVYLSWSPSSWMLSGLPFGLFRNCLPEIKCFGHLTFFGLFWVLMKIVYFKDCFGQIWEKFVTFSEILNSSLVILTNFWRKLAFYLFFFHFLGFGLFLTWQPWMLFQFFLSPSIPPVRS